MKFLVPLALCACWRLDFDPRADARTDGIAADCSAFSLAGAQVNVSSYVQLAPVGATGQVTYTLSGPGAVTGSTFIAPAYRATTMVTATDDAGCIAHATIAIGGTTLFYLGSEFNAVPTADVWRAPTPLAWTKIGSLPGVRVSGGATVFHDAMWYVGGSTDLSVNGNTNVWSSTDGLMWTNAGTFPVPITDTALIAFHDQLWIVGGHGNPGAVWSSPDGASWTQTATLPFPAHGGQLIVAHDRLVYLGGHDDTNLYDTEYASSDGITWTNVGTLPSKREFQATAEHDGQFEFAGGTDITSYLQDSFQSVDGLVWTATGTLPAQRMYGQLHWVNDRYYCVGGTDGGDIWSSVDGQVWAVENSTLTHPRDAGELLEFTPH